MHIARGCATLERSGGLPAWLRQRYSVDVAPVAVIAAEAGVHPGNIYRALHRYGIELRGRPDAGWGPILTRPYLAARLGQGESATDIARDLGCSHQTILEYVHHHKLRHLFTPHLEPPSKAQLDRIAELHRAGWTRGEDVGCGVRTVTRRLATVGLRGQPGRPPLGSSPTG